MKKIYFDYKKLNTLIISELSNCVNDLNKYISEANNISYPSDFNGTNTLRTVNNNVIDLKRKINSKKKYLEDLAEGMKDFISFEEEEMALLLNKNFDLKVRNNIVK